MQNKTKHFEGVTIYVGIDVHLKSWSVAPFTEGTALKRFSLSPPSPDQLAQTLRTTYPGADFVCCYEAGYCGFWIQRALEKLGLPTQVVNPADIPMSNKDLLRKTDSRDASKIGRALRSGDLEAIYIPSVDAEKDRSIIRYRTQLVKDERRVKQRIKMYLHAQGIQTEGYSLIWSRKTLAYLSGLAQELEDEYLALSLQQLEQLWQAKTALNKKIKGMSQSDKYKALSTLLMTVPGISYLGAMILITELIDIKRFANLDHLCSYVGLVPDTRSSSEQEQVRGITKRSNKRLRILLVEASWIAIRQDPVLTLAYSKYKANMRGQKAIIKIARKLLNRIRTVWLKQLPYQLGKA